MGGTATPRSQFGLVVWVTALTAGLLVFHQLGSGWLEPPPVRPGGWGAWAEGRDPLVATVAVLRLIVLALGWYLLLVTALGIVVRLVRAPRVARVADRVTVPALRRLLRDALGATLATAVIAGGPVGHTARADAAPPPVGHDREVARGGDDVPDGAGRDAATLPGTSIPLPLDLAGGRVASAGDATNGDPDPPDGAERPDGSARGDDSAGSAPPGGEASGAGADLDSGAGAGADAVPGSDLDAVPGADLDSGAGAGADVDSGAGAGADAVPGAGADAVPAGEVTVSGERAVIVQPGDSLWSLARDALVSRSPAPRSDPPDEAEVAAYWTVVVKHNRRHLPDPQNPDLIFPGDTVLLPPVSEGASSR